MASIRARSHGKLVALDVREDDDSRDFYWVTITHSVAERDDDTDLKVVTEIAVFLPEAAATIVQRIRDSVVDLNTHEVNETYYVSGVRLFDPHV